MINFHLQHPNYKVPARLKMRKWLSGIINANGLLVGEINYIFDTDEAVRIINRDYLQHDYYTDIVTFDNRLKPTQKILEADIYISLDRIAENADTYKVDFYTELRRVMAHGLLHLLGHADKTEEEQAAMRKAEDDAQALYK